LVSVLLEAQSLTTREIKICGENVENFYTLLSYDSGIYWGATMKYDSTGETVKVVWDAKTFSVDDVTYDLEKKIFIKNNKIFVPDRQFYDKLQKFGKFLIEVYDK
jgi:hypothetical protein